MSDANTNILQPQAPDPHRAPSARLDPVGTGKLLHLLRTLLTYGRNLVEKLREEDDPDDLPWYGFLTSLFGTTDPALITVVIIRGLLRAVALQARLSGSLARVRDCLLPLPVRESGGARGPSRAQPRAPRWAFPEGWPAGESFLDRQPHDRQPTPEEEMYADILAKDRDRPIGAILLDICRDLGIVPALMDPATWEELRLAITLHGGDPAPLLANADVTGVGRKTPDLFRGHSATDTPDPGDSPTIPIAGIAYPPWPAPPDQPLPSWEDQWDRGPDP